MLIGLWRNIIRCTDRPIVMGQIDKATHSCPSASSKVFPILLGLFPLPPLVTTVVTVPLFVVAVVVAPAIVVVVVVVVVVMVDCLWRWASFLSSLGLLPSFEGAASASPAAVTVPVLAALVGVEAADSFLPEAEVDDDKDEEDEGGG